MYALQDTKLPEPDFSREELCFHPGDIQIRLLIYLYTHLLTYIIFIRRSYESAAVASVRGAGIGAARRRSMACRSLGQRGEDFGGLGGLYHSDLCVRCRI